VKTVGAMQHTSKQLHICIMKKFRQHFKIAIITPSDGFTQISIDFASQVSSQKTAPSCRAYKMCEKIRAEKLVLSSLEGRLWSFRHLSHLEPLHYVGYRLGSLNVTNTRREAGKNNSWLAIMAGQHVTYRSSSY